MEHCCEIFLTLQLAGVPLQRDKTRAQLCNLSDPLCGYLTSWYAFQHWRFFMAPTHDPLQRVPYLSALCQPSTFTSFGNTAVCGTAVLAGKT